MEKIGVSACLLGINCKYNGKDNLNLEVLRYIAGKEVVLICPEVMGGLSTPRIPCEIQANGKVLNQNNVDVTEAFNLGKHLSLTKLKENDCNQVILKDGSPSCGFLSIYDGSFTNKLIKGQGVTTKFLKDNHIQVIHLDT
ncbi:DUF523 domain-containing protein [Mycoplasmatota bacterium]|nr:DUF523 domain-containing protein [Mycoplasmatota bacterium]